MSTILFVDDHHAFRTVFAEVLRLKVYTVLEAGAVDEPNWDFEPRRRNHVL